MLRRAILEHRRWITQTIGDIITSNSADFYTCYTSILGTSPMCHRYVCDILNLGLPRRIFATVWRCSVLFCDILTMVLGDESLVEIPMHALPFFSMSRCLGETVRSLADVADHSPNHWRLVAMPRRYPYLCITKASGGLKNPVGP